MLVQLTVPLVLIPLPTPLLNVVLTLVPPDISLTLELVLLVDLTVMPVLLPPPVLPVLPDISHPLVPVLNVPLTVTPVPLPLNVTPMVVTLLMLTSMLPLKLVPLLPLVKLTNML